MNQNLQNSEEKNLNIYSSNFKNNSEGDNEIKLKFK